MVKAKVALLRFYNRIPLYTRVGAGYALYKPAGMTLSEMHAVREKHLGELYLREEDRITGLRDAQSGFNGELRREVSTGSARGASRVLVNIVEETLAEPGSGSLEGFAETLDILLARQSEELSMVSWLINLAPTYFSTSLHSINVMALALNFAYFSGFSPEDSKLLGLGGLLHDVGKTRIPRHLLVAPRKLTREEFSEMQKHTTKGYNILKECNFNNDDLSALVLEHHEKIDGSGYPSGKTSPSYFAQIIGIIDCYAALTTDDRPYRHAVKPFPALEVIRNDVLAGKYSDELFRQFAYSLTE